MSTETDCLLLNISDMIARGNPAYQVLERIKLAHFRGPNRLSLSVVQWCLDNLGYVPGFYDYHFLRFNSEADAMMFRFNYSTAKLWVTQNIAGTSVHLGDTRE